MHVIYQNEFKTKHFILFQIGFGPGEIVSKIVDVRTFSKIRQIRLHFVHDIATDDDI